jgi:aspartyl-tRNA(Asn)/glutamyl-tRNA(Gln) amidotransferase subunit B
LKGAEKFGTKAEVKNMNSFRNVERALEYEINRQIELLEDGGTVVQETLLWDADKNVALAMRSKEEAHDYRYFPDPDLVPVLVDQAWLTQIQSTLPELPVARRNRFVEAYKLPIYDATILTQEKRLADYYEGAVGLLDQKNEEGFKAVSNWVMTDVLRVVNEEHLSITQFAIAPDRLAAMINLISSGVISGKIAKEVFAEMLKSGEQPKAIVERLGLVQVSDSSAIEKVIDGIIARSAAQVEQYRAGKTQVFGYFVGETMKAMKGKANPKVVNEILKAKLG